MLTGPLSRLRRQLPQGGSIFRPDPYIALLLGVVVLASLAPVRGEAAVAAGWAAKGVIALLFFLHGARLPREAVIRSLAHWRLHLSILAVTFALFPLLGLAAGLLPERFLPEPLALGVLFLACLPSTVQSSVAFTAIAKGDVAAAVCGAAASNLLGMALTPLLVGLLMHAQGSGPGWETAGKVAAQLLLPFAAGQLARPWIGDWLTRNGKVMAPIDRGSILLVVYVAFSGAVTAGVWGLVSWPALVTTGLICLAMLALVLWLTARIARLQGFSTEDEIALVFCGSKKSLVTGAPMAAILFAPAVAGVMVLPLMIYHQLQMIACAALAQRYARR